MYVCMFMYLLRILMVHYIKKIYYSDRFGITLMSLRPNVMIIKIKYK